MSDVDYKKLYENIIDLGLEFAVYIIKLMFVYFGFNLSIAQYFGFEKITIVQSIFLMLFFAGIRGINTSNLRRK